MKCGHNLSRRIVLCRKDFNRQWNCCFRKKKFQTKEKADIVVLRMQIQQTSRFETLHSYQCSVCHKWHVGHKQGV